MIHPLTNVVQSRVLYSIYLALYLISFSLTLEPDIYGYDNKAEREPVLRMRVTSLGPCLRVIVNANPLYLEKTTSSVISVLLLIYVTINLEICF